MADSVAKTSTPDAASGNPIDITTVVTGAGTVERQRVSIADSVTATDAPVTAAGLKVDVTFPGTQGVSATVLPLPTGASTETTLALIKAKTDNLDVALSTRTKPADTQAVSAVTLPLPTNASTETTLALIKAKTDNLDVLLSSRTKPADSQHVTVDNASLGVTGVDTTLGATVTPKAASVWDVADRAARLVGRVYGSQGNQLLQTPTNFNTQVEVAVGATLIDPRVIRALTNADVVTNEISKWIGSTAPTVGQKAMASSLPVAIASDQSAIPILASGDVDHDVVNTLKTVQVGGHASPVDVPPTAVSANADRARIWVDRFGAQIVRRRKIRESYTASFRLAETAARLDQTFTHVANTNKQYATLYHTVSATKEVRLQYCIVWIEAWSVATQGILELRELTGATAPATGNPAITPKPRRVGGSAAEATCLYLPTTQGSETSVNSPLKSIFLDEGIMGAVSTVNPLPNIQGIVLYNSSQEDDEMLPPTLPVTTAGGWAVMLRTVGIPAVRLVCEMGFTEETP